MRISNLPIPALNGRLTFRPYLQYIEAQIATTTSTVYKTYLESVASLIRKSPELLEPITDFNVLDNHTELIDLIRITHLSQAPADEPMIAFGLPFGSPPQLNFWGYTEQFARFFKEKGPLLRLTSKEIGEEFQRNTYRNILKKAYGIESPDDSNEPMLQISFNENNITHHYKVIRRHLFAALLNRDNLPELRQEWIDYATGMIATHAELKSPIPFERFPIEGFFIFSILPETEKIALEELTKIVTDLHTNKAEDTIGKLKSASLSLIGSANLEIGFLAFLKVNDKYVYHDLYASTSLLFGKLKKHFNTEELEEMYQGIVSNTMKYSSTQASLNNDLCEIEEECSQAFSHVRKVLEGEGLVSMKFIPVWHNEVLLGVIEIGGKHESDITIEVLNKINAAIPAYREFFMYKISSIYDYMNSFIMQRYTSIQKSVAWKFNDEVWTSLRNTSSPKDFISTPPVRFENLYPFYGAVDFRNSTLKQQEAIHHDYQTQLEYLDTLIPADMQSDSTVHEFRVKLKFWLEELTKSHDLLEEEELRVLLETESVNFVSYLADKGKIDRSVLTSYHNALSSKFGKFHAFHNQYEESVQELNKILREELHDGEAILQEKVPHYFEKFQTDGIEYSLYAGKNIDPSRPFPSNSVETIIEWQLKVMLQMAKAAKDHSKYLSVPLETTQLILVHENPVDISYRIDERHFDVEGSYSIRYQVLKKRIDKVRIAGTAERLTQPNTISIVYSNNRSIEPYLENIRTLTAEGKLHPEIEYLDLEQLQGVGKMKAIRIKINIGSNDILNERVSDIVALN